MLTYSVASFTCFFPRFLYVRIEKRNKREEYNFECRVLVTTETLLLVELVAVVFFFSRGRIWTKIWTDFNFLTEHFAILIDAQYIQCWQWGMEQLEDILTWIVWIIDKCQGSLSPQLKWMLNQKRAIKLAFFYDGAKFCFFFVTFKLPMTKFVIQTKIDHNTIEIYSERSMEMTEHLLFAFNKPIFHNSQWYLLKASRLCLIE